MHTGVDEAVCLEALRRLDGNEPSVHGLDEVCRLVACHFRVPIAVVSLISDDRQYFIGRHGTQHRSAAVQGSIASHAVADNDVLIIEDARNESRFSDCSPIGDAQIRFCAGAPLMHASGTRLGILFIADQRPATFEPGQCEALKTFAGLVTAKLSLWQAELQAHALKRALDQQETALAQARDLASVAMWEWELDSDRIRWSDGVRRLFDSSPTESDTTFGRFIETVVHPDDRAAVEAAASASRDQGSAINAKFRIVRPDGRLHTLVSSGDVIKENGRPARVVGVVQDVSDRDRSEAALRASEARWRLALKTGRMIAFDVDLETGTATLSDHAQHIVGFTHGHYADFFGAIHPQDRPRVEAVVERAIAEQSLFHVEFRLVRPDGRVAWLSQSGGLTEKVGGEARHLAGVCIDITEQKGLERALRDSEERERAFAAVSSDWRWETDENLRFTLNLGGPPDSGIGGFDMIGKTRWEVARAHPTSEPWKSHIRDHEARLEFRNFEYELEDSTGNVRCISTSGRPFFDDEGRFRGYRGAASDQTARKKLEAILQQSQRMEAIGQLSGGVAHDFNNLLTIILGNAEVLVERLDAEGKLQPLAALILSAAERGADLTDRLLAFARRQALEPVSMSVNAAVERMAGILQRSVGDHIRLELSLAEDLHWAHVDAALLESTILNLAVNARDAMPQGGTMTIATTNLVVESTADDEYRDLAPGDYVKITVMDTGAGMSPEVLQRVFEPFFTTKGAGKGAGKGSGLGLPMAQGFASQSGGQITVESQPGCGTRVSLILPRSKSVPLAGDTSEKIDGLAGGSERILVVEDEPDVRRYVVAQLESLGYATEEAGDGPSALAVLQSSKAFDLLFTDVVLPMHMNGLELAARARAMCPQLKVLFSSGFSAQVSA
ncbi:MAG: PAS domain-containing protein, partial [bacterium]